MRTNKRTNEKTGQGPVFGVCQFCDGPSGGLGAVTTIHREIVGAVGCRIRFPNLLVSTPPGV